MSSSIVNNFYDPQIPGVFSVKTLGKLRGEVGTNTKARNGGLGGNGVIISDDLNVPGATTYIKNTS